jgi:hypothetical protein
MGFYRKKIKFISPDGIHRWTGVVGDIQEADEFDDNVARATLDANNGDYVEFTENDLEYITVLN